MTYAKLKNWIDLGVSDPLTLGMASPLADRIEILTRQRPTTRLSRGLAGGALLALATLSAPLTIAASHPDEDEDRQIVFHLSDGATWSNDGKTKLKSGHAFEIRDNDGELSAVKISEGGTVREPVDIEKTDEDSYKLTLVDGEVVMFDEPDLSGLDALDGLDGLDALKSLKGLEKLERLSVLSALSELSELAEMDVVSKGARTFTFDGDDLDGFAQNETLRDKIREAMKSGEGLKSLRVLRRGDAEGEFKFPEFDENQRFELKDSIVDGKIIMRFFDEDESLEASIRQLDATRRRLEELSEDQDLAFDLQNAMRDLENARKSLEEAEKRLEERGDD